MIMSKEKQDKILEKIRALGFKPYPYTNPKDFEINPACIEPPVDFNVDDWLSINQCEAIAQKSDRTVYRWQNTAGLINFTVLPEGKDRNNVRHYIYKNDFIQYMQHELNEKVVYVYKNPVTHKTEGISDITTEGREVDLSADMTTGHKRQEVQTLAPETAEKLLALPEEINKRFEAAILNVLGKQKEEFVNIVKQEVVNGLEPYTKFLKNQLEDKTKEAKEKEDLLKSVNQLSKSFSKTKIAISLVVIFFCLLTFGITTFLQSHARKEREEVEKRLATEYAQKLTTFQNSQKEDFKKLNDSLKNLKERLNVKEAIGMELKENSPAKEEGK